MSGTLALLRLHILLPCHDIHFKHQNFEVIFRLESEIHWLTTKHCNVTLNPQKIPMFLEYTSLLYIFRAIPHSDPFEIIILQL